MFKTAALALIFSARLALAEPFSVVILGDMPYGLPPDVFPPYETLISTINEADPRLVIHLGDTMGGTSCGDGEQLQQLEYLNEFIPPVLYTPGDNEWTDCYQTRTGAFNPLERLDFIRSAFFADPARSLGQSELALTHQGAAGHPENARVRIGDVMFVTAHVVGSNNGFEPRDRATVLEYFDRNEANLRWLKESFAAADDAAALVLAIHGDMFEFGFGPRWNREAFLRHSGFKSFGEALIREANAFERPVLLTYGDSHIFRMFRPFPRSAPNITALESFGHPHMHALEILIDTEAGYPFAVRPLLNPDQPLQPVRN